MTRSTQFLQERAWVEVNLAHLSANARTVQAAARGARLLPMVKANAYGLGAVRVAETLEHAVDPWGFGVATIVEGIELRSAGIRRPIVVFTPALLEDRPRYQEFDLQAVLDTPQVAARWDLPYQLEIDTGMGRSGVRWDDPSLAQCRSASLRGVFMHFYSAEDNPASVDEQWTRFRAALQSLGEPRPPLVYAANSAAVWHFDRPLDLVRPGIFLYGCKPMADAPEPRPVASFRARVVSLRTIGSGESVSYGAEWLATRDSEIATVGVGYADGYTRTMQGKASALIGGQRFPVVGRITMDMILMDVTAARSPVRRGEPVTLVGSDGSETITWEDLASWAGTNTYEMMCSMSPRVQRVYLDA